MPIAAKPRSLCTSNCFQRVIPAQIRSLQCTVWHGHADVGRAMVNDVRCAIGTGSTELVQVLSRECRNFRLWHIAMELMKSLHGPFAWACTCGGTQDTDCD